jgi:hypothetical protein
MSAGASKAEALDRTDPLRGRRELFELPAGVADAVAALHDVLTTEAWRDTKFSTKALVT